MIFSVGLLALAAFTTAAPTSSNISEPYDYIVVGGGTAGIALASRLSDRFPLDRILVIEAGPYAPDEPRINTPGRKGSTLGTSYDWNFTTIPQENASRRRAYQPSNVDPTTYTRTYSANTYFIGTGYNLELRANTLVDTVTFEDGEDGDLHTTGTPCRLARSIQSSGILERSGVGLASTLEPLGVPVRLALPVGENLQDHIRVQTSFQLRDNYTSFDKLRYDPVYAAEQLTLWGQSQPSAYDYTGSEYFFGTWPSILGNSSSHLLSLATRALGNSTSPIAAEKLKYLTTPLGDNVPQLEIIFSDGYTGVKGYPSVNSTLYGKGFITLISALQHPLSVGNIHISSLAPGATPLINPNYLSYEYEVEALVAAIKYARRVASTYPLAQSWESEYEPGPAVQTDEQIRQYIRDTVLTIYHPVGTCAMLPREKGGVVDPELRVYGTQGLRVVDASVMPILPPGHIQTGVYAIAERGADFITETWRG
ncbi:hypothetical protein KVT40_005189 [Elsinoe batatas]|uniref:Glucose-methanol-choline oxidoreductase C-terminal domain-containing protein n=1 Tax=Elsinoe batatas TaxID=2601811 RepID=A0A8K0L0M6_9PEZI|nr:hypothetical protein KVT40_005189 [Elsinoe batatas]